MNTTAQLVQRAVRATNSWPLLCPLYRAVYRAAAGAAGRLARANDAIAGIYARNSFALGTWEAGRSDIDLTVLWRRPGLTQVDAFHRDYARLKRVYPMLGEVEMLDERHIEAWSRHGLTGLETARWLKLGGHCQWQCRYAGCEEWDRVRQAVSIYRHQFIPRYWEEPRKEELLRRLAAKIGRQLGVPAALDCAHQQLPVQLLALLTGAIARLPAPPGGPVVDYGSLLGSIRRAEAGPASTYQVMTLGAEHGPRHVVVATAEEAGCEAIGAFRGAAIFTPEVLRFYLCSVDPLEYFALLQGRSMLLGRDPLGAPFAMTEAALRGTVCHYAVDLLTFPYREGLGTMGEEQFRDILYGWYLRTLRYLEDGRFVFDYYDMRQHYGQRYSEGLGRFEVLRAIAGAVGEQMLR